jgi:drug/metabolite transporter (DMT)-like permease
VAGALATIYVVWGSTYLAIALMVRSIPPLLGGAVRFLAAGALLYAWIRLRRPGPGLSPRELAGAGLVGTLLVLGGNGLVTVAERDVPSSLAALLIASEPLWVVLLRRATRERLPPSTLFGVFAGFVGVGLLLAPGQRPEGVGAVGLFLCVMAAVCWASGSFAASRMAPPADPLRATAAQMLLGGAATLVAAAAIGDFGALRLDAVTTVSAAALAYLTLIGSVVAFSTYAWLLRNVPISTVSTYAYVNPVIAVALGWAILSEPVTAATLTGAAVIVCSVAFIMRREGTAAPESAPPQPEAVLAESAASRGRA